MGLIDLQHIWLNRCMLKCWLEKGTSEDQTRKNWGMLATREPEKNELKMWTMTCRLAS